MTETEHEIDSSDTEANRAPGAGAVVVGVDGSTGSRSALHWAIGEARARGAGVYAVMAWQQPIPSYGGTAGWASGRDASANSQEGLARAAGLALERLRLDHLEDPVAVADDVSVEYEAVEGRPSEVLLEASRNAIALVVGSRGHGGFVGSLLGSVSHQVVHHATCPVVVVPAPPSMGPALSHERLEPIQRHDSFITLAGVAP
jgi:nucleotide-binding universal stress UspA family protein